MRLVQEVGVVVLVLGGILAATAWRRATRRAERSATSGRIVSRRITDREARAQQSIERWDNEGGAVEGGTDAIVR